MALSGSAAADRRPTWFLLDRNGTVVHELAMDKNTIMHRLGIHARDFQILDPMLSYPSAILGREKVILLNLEHIKAIITANEVLVRDPRDEHVIPIVEQLQRKFPKEAVIHIQSNEENESPFEFRALEVVLKAICSFLDGRAKELETTSNLALPELSSKISIRSLNGVRELKRTMTQLTNKVQKIRDELKDLLGDNADMAVLYLSRKMAGSCSSTSSCDVGELERLLEAYFIQIDGTLNKLNTLQEYIDDTEDYINIQLDNHRNQLIQLELFLNIGAVCVSLYSLVAAIFGMNIPYAWTKGPDYMFIVVIICVGIVCVSLFLCIALYARHKGLIGS